MKVVALRLGIFGSDRIRAGTPFDIPEGAPMPSWAVSAEDYEAPVPGVDEPTTLGALAAPAPDMETGKAAATLPPGTVVVSPSGKKRPRPASAPAPVDDLTD